MPQNFSFALCPQTQPSILQHFAENKWFFCAQNAAETAAVFHGSRQRSITRGLRRKIKEEKRNGRKEKVQARASAQTHHRHHHRHPVRPVPAGGLLPLCGDALVVLQPVPVVHHSADDPRLRHHGHREPQERRRQAAAHHGRARLLLDPDRRFGLVLRRRHPVPAFHER